MVGQVFVDSHDVGLVQIERGMAWHYKAYEREQHPEDTRAYAGAEVEAKAARRGCGPTQRRCRRGSGEGQGDEGVMRFVLTLLLMLVAASAWAGPMEDALAC